MLQLRQLLIPTRTSHAIYENSKKVKFVDISQQIIDGDIHFSAITTTGRIVKIIVHDKVIRITSQCRAQCDCPDFTFRQAYVFNRKNLLTNPEEYSIIPLSVRPKKANVYGILRPCKHLYALAHIILKRKIRRSNNK